MTFKIVIISGLLALAGCNTESSDNIRSKKTKFNKKQDSADAMTKEEAFLNLTSIKLKNCDQLLRTMAKLTGVDFNSPKVKTAYKELKGGCPGAEDLDSLSPSNIGVAVKLSVEFCGLYSEKLMTSKKISSLDFSKTPGEAFTSAAKEQLFKDFYNTLWNGDVRSDIPSYESLKKASEKTLSELLSEDELKNKDGATKFVVQGLCAPVLSAAPVTTL